MHVPKVIACACLTGLMILAGCTTAPTIPVDPPWCPAPVSDPQFKKMSHISADSRDLTWVRSCILGFAAFAATQQNLSVSVVYFNSGMPQAQAIPDEARRAQLDGFVQDARTTGAKIIFDTRQPARNSEPMPAITIQFAPKL